MGAAVHSLAGHIGRGALNVPATSLWTIISAMPPPRLRALVVLLLFPGYLAAAGLADTYPRQPGVDVEHYAFHLILGDDSDEIRGQAEITVHLTLADIRQLRLDLVHRRDASGGKGMTVTSARVNGSPARFVHENDSVTVQIPAGVPEDSRIQVSLGYHGVPVDGLRIGPTGHGARTFFSDNWPNRARHWLPTIDHIGDKATHEFVVDAPSHYQVVSNGLKIEESDLGKGVRRTHWKQSVPTSPWLYCLGVAEFAMQRVDTFDGKEIQVWVFPEDRESGLDDLNGPTRHALEFFSDYVGPFAYEKLANVQASSVGGGMEAASAIFYSETGSVGQKTAFWRRNAIVHEIAHQWFGNAVTEADWDHVWLSEGVTTYFTLLFREHAFGREDFVDGLRDARRSVWDFYQKNPDYTLVHANLDDMSKVTTGNTYQKGAWFMHMLRTRLGDTAFQRGIRDYYRDHFNGHAVTDDLRRAMEAASGDDLQAFFHQWLYQGGHVVLTGAWTFADDTLAIELEQSQTGAYRFDVPVEIGIYENGSLIPTIQTLRLDGPGKQQLQVRLKGKPDRVVLDPRTVLLAEWSFSER